MLKQLLAGLGELSGWWSARVKPPTVTEHTRLGELIRLYPETRNALKRRFGIELKPVHHGFSLKRLCFELALPAPQIVFMEIQMFERAKKVCVLLPRQAADFLKDPSVRVLDVRETWELKWGSLPRAETLSLEAMENALMRWPKDSPVLLYCHFGVRSLDAAVFFADAGFTNVSCIKGGIDAWAIEIDPSLQRYESAWC